MSQQSPIITVENGQLQGTTKVDWLGRKYYSFQGIPYAKPPLGKLRFKAPQPAEPWQGIRDASKEGNDCFSRNLLFKNMTGAEDCLFLNVYTTQLPVQNQQLKPVMVWIHGGAFIGGSGSTELYGPEFLVAEDVVLVTINYRLGLLGFAYFADPSLEIPGNAALKDQVLALQWVKANISKFGGDCNNVTIFGESAGGASVHYLLLSPLAKGLFHKGIAQSGVATADWSQGKLTAPLVAKALGLENSDESDIINILLELPVDKVFEIQEKIPEAHSISEYRPFGPVVESPQGKYTFLPDDPVNILKSGRYNDVPFMIGYTSKEGMLLEFTHTMKFGEIQWISDYESVIPHDLRLAKNSDISKIVADKIKQFYYGNETASFENINSFYLIHTDTYFFISIHAAVRLHIETSSKPVYFYRMSVDTNLNMFKKLASQTRSGAAHGDDIGYLFKNSLTPQIRPKSPEDIALRRFVKLWTTFAKYGNPNPVHKDPLINVTWLPVENNKLNYLDIGDNLTVGVDPDVERAEFWDEIYNLCSNVAK